MAKEKILAKQIGSGKVLLSVEIGTSTFKGVIPIEEIESSDNKKLSRYCEMINKNSHKIPVIGKVPSQDKMTEIEVLIEKKKERDRIIQEEIDKGVSYAKAVENTDSKLKAEGGK